MSVPHFTERLSRRRTTFFTLVFVTVLVGVTLLADRLWQEGAGISGMDWAMLVVFVPLFFQLSMGFWVVLLGLWTKYVKKSDALAIDDKLTDDEWNAVPLAPTAVLIPVYNEEVLRVFEGLRSVYESVEKTGQLDNFEFFVLSDSDNPNRWIEEETAWMELCKQLNAFGKIFYRKRRKALNRKSGNVADFCRRWGAKYRYMVVFDADSVMSGDTLVKMVRLMERHPKTGIIQTAPKQIYSETVFSRVFQFANALYSPVFMAGLNYWQAGESSFWGHNAIIRIAPFMQHCDLPVLPGSGPLGGHILSHDLVEAALMRKAGYAVWLAPSLEGSYEEGPPTFIDSLKRDRRWCQGNLQHFLLLFDRQWKGISRLNLAGGVINYLTSPIWLGFLLISSFAARHNAFNPDPVPQAVVAPATQPAAAPASAAHSPSTPAAPAPAPAASAPTLVEDARSTISAAGDKISFWTGMYRDLTSGFRDLVKGVRDAPKYLLLFVTIAMIFGPKFLIAAGVLLDSDLVRKFGGRPNFIATMLVETVFFALMAPVLMIFHSRFVLMIILGQSVRWVTQRRSVGTLDWREPILTFGGVTLIFGIGWGIVAWIVSPVLFWCLSPVLLGITLAVPFAIVTSMKMEERPGESNGLFRSPDLVEEPEVLATLRTHLESAHARIEPHELLRKDYGLMLVILDPYINALHCSLLRQRKSPPPESKRYYSNIAKQILEKGPGSVKSEDKLALLYDIESLSALHREVWSLPSAKIAPWWQLAIGQYNVFGREPLKPLYR